MNSRDEMVALKCGVFWQARLGRWHFYANRLASPYVGLIVFLPSRFRSPGAQLYIGTYEFGACFK